MEKNFKESHPRIEINIGERIVSVTCYISIKDIGYFIESKNLKSSEIVLGILNNHIDTKEKIELLKISKSDIENFIDNYVISNESLNVFYINSSLENKYDRFVEAFQLYTDDINLKMKELLKPLSELIAEFTRNIQSIYKPTVDIMIKLGQTITDYSSVFTKFSNAIADLANSIKIPSLSDEQKKELQDSYKAWGKYGWTVPPYASLSIFDKKPKSLQEANKYMRQYINTASMKELFIELGRLDNLRKDDLQEAILNFENRRYKSCSMILFALIDGKIIRYQDKKTYRKVGFYGAKKICNEIESEFSSKNKFFFLLKLININSALEFTFKSAENFKEQPTVVNRNFIHHGMLYGRVRRRDAAQLFLLLYNLIELFDFCSD